MIATVEIAGLQGKLMFRLRESTGGLEGMFDYELFEVAELPDLENPDAVRTYGKSLVEALGRHGAVQNVLEQCFGVTPPEAATLQFDIATVEAERYRWETLYHEPKFLALHEACTMRRVVSNGLAGVPPPCGYDGRIRIVALLSPAQVDSANEFRALADAFDAARAAHPDVGFELHAYIGQAELLAAIREDIEAGRHPDIAVYPMPASTAALEQELRVRTPQILHCFCHGLVQDGVRILQFATRTDHAAGEPEGSVSLSITRLVALQAIHNNTWLTVLNSCSGAEAVPRLNSMAGTLTRSTSPVTIGMADRIHEADATLFSQNFYPRALLLVGAAAGATSKTQAVPLDLGLAIGDARYALHKAAQAGDARNFRRWCLPVMYQRAAGLSLIRVAPPEEQARLKMVADLLRSLPADAPKKLRIELRDLLNKDPVVDPALWPDEWGNFV